MLKINKILTTLAIILSCSMMGIGQPEELGIYEKLDDYIPSDLVFVDENYDTLNILKAIDKPTVIVPVYYQCPGLCSPLLEGVADVISHASMQLGKDYQVFTVSFNPEEKPKLAKEKKINYLKLISATGQMEEGWRFFTGDSSNIFRLLNSIGYKLKKEGKDYIHPAAIVVVSPQGKITRYLHGTYFLPFDLKMAVIEASHGRSEPTINKVLQFCFSYDAKGKKYVFNITKVSGGLILFIAISFLVSLLIKGNKRKQPNPEK